MLSKEAEQLRDKFVAGIENNNLPLFACCVSWLMLNTCFVQEITKLDPNNTYVCPTRPEDAVGSNDSICSTAVLKSVQEYSSLIPFLDADIIDRVDTQSMPSVLGAISLQLLRGMK